MLRADTASSALPIQQSNKALNELSHLNVVKTFLHHQTLKQEKKLLYGKCGSRIYRTIAQSAVQLKKYTRAQWIYTIIDLFVKR